MFGSMLVQYAISWYITLKTGSGAMMTVSTDETCIVSCKNDTTKVPTFFPVGQHTL